MSNRDVLFVFLHNQFIGTLHQKNGLLIFQYKDEANLPLSFQLPLQKAPFSPQQTEAFFSGLLPDEPIRSKISKILKISSRNTFGLLEKLGGDCAGAITILTSSELHTGERTTKHLTSRELFSILQNLPQRPLGIGIEGVRISGAGAQAKLMVTKIGNAFHLPLDGMPSTHIIKPSIKGVEASVFNEFFCMRLASKIGLQTPSVDIFSLEKESFYVVERYDRFLQEEQLIRIHQEDFCQILGIPPNRKYQNEGGPSIPQMFQVLREFQGQRRMMGKDTLSLLRLIIFNFLIGNGDAHGKNFSLLYQGEKVSLAPCYDLLSTMVYFGKHEDKMAMKIGSKYKFKDVVCRHFLTMADEIGISQKLIKKEMKSMAEKLPSKANQLVEELSTIGDNAPIYQKIIDVIQEQARKIKNC